MISVYDVREYIKKQSDSIGYHVDGDNVVNNETNEALCSIDDFTQRLRKHLHCDFETLYSSYGSAVLRCRECGTVIFIKEVDFYECLEPNLCCPVCSDYKTKFVYWTKEDIESDTDKQKELEVLAELRREDIEADKRFKKRGKCDSEIVEHTFKTRRRVVIVSLECDNLFKTKLKGLRLNIRTGNRENNLYTLKKFYVIPLSLSALKYKMIAKKMGWR